MFRAAVVLTAAVLAMPALADVHVSFVDQDGNPGSQIYVKGGKVRVEGGDSHGHGIAIYDTASNSFTVLMPDRKSYMVMNEQSATQMGNQMQAAQAQMQGAQAQMQAQMAAHQGQMDQAQAQMQAAMAKMSPEQRAMMQKMMPQMGQQPGGMPSAMNGGPVMPQMTLKDLGTGETVDGHSCKDMQMMIGTTPGMKMCVAPVDSLGIPAADLDTLKAMREGMKKIASHMGPMAQNMQNMMVEGFAIKTESSHKEGFKTVTETNTLKSVSTGSLSGDLFQVPAGYTETNMQQMMHEHGG